MRQEKLPEAAFFVPVEKRCACSPDVVAATIGSLLNASAKRSMMLVPADAGHRLRWLHPVVWLRCSTSSPEPDDPMEKYRAVFA
jgi:hypothetical protein